MTLHAGKASLIAIGIYINMHTYIKHVDICMTYKQKYTK